MKDIIMQFIHWGEDALFKHPKVLIFLLLACFVTIMLANEGINRSNQAKEALALIPTSTPIRAAIEYYQNLPDIVNDKTPLPTPTEVGQLIKRMPTETPSSNFGNNEDDYYGVCLEDTSKNAVKVGVDAEITYLGGYASTLNLRYRYNDPQVVVGSVSSGTKVYVIDGPECLQGIRYWKVNSAKDRIVGWIPELVQGRPTMGRPTMEVLDKRR